MGTFLIMSKNVIALYWQYMELWRTRSYLRQMQRVVRQNRRQIRAPSENRGGGWQEKFIRFFIYNFVVDNAEET